MTPEQKAHLDYMIDNFRIDAFIVNTADVESFFGKSIVGSPVARFGIPIFGSDYIDRGKFYIQWGNKIPTKSDMREMMEWACKQAGEDFNKMISETENLDRKIIHVGKEKSVE